MPPTPREQAHIERRLIACLTQACEQAKLEIPGFLWLTHDADYATFPASLRVIWVFDTQVNKTRTVASDHQARVIRLTGQALADADIAAIKLDRIVRFDSEEECLRCHGGDWRLRIARVHATQGAR